MKYMFISIITAALDLAVKDKIKVSMKPGEKKHIYGRLYLWHIKNKGLIFNKLENNRKRVMLLSGTALMSVFTILVYLIRTGAKPLIKLGPALILGGGLGNFIDRVRNGEVTDYIFIKVPKAPIFNVADIAAAIGGLITILKSLI